MGEPNALIELMAAVAAGDKPAFAQLYQLTSTKLFALALGILRRRDWAEDVLQEAYLRIWRSAQKFDPAKGSPMSWMVTIVRNSAFTMLDRRGRETAATSEADIEAMASGNPDPLDQAMASSDARALMACLQELDEKQRRTIALAYYEGLTHAELSERLGTPIGTIKSWIRRGLMTLKRCLESRVDRD